MQLNIVDLDQILHTLQTLYLVLGIAVTSENPEVAYMRMSAVQQSEALHQSVYWYSAVDKEYAEENKSLPLVEEGKLKDAFISYSFGKLDPLLLGEVIKKLSQLNSCSVDRIACTVITDLKNKKTYVAYGYLDSIQSQKLVYSLPLGTPAL
jgi:hypothetical protein